MQSGNGLTEIGGRRFENNMEVLEKLAKEKVDARFIKGAFPSTISKKGKELLDSANVDVDNTAIAKAFKSAATKPQIKVDVKFEFADGSSYKFKLPIYIEIKKEKKHTCQKTGSYSPKYYFFLLIRYVQFFSVF